jgi:hypothetical protein
MSGPAELSEYVRPRLEKVPFSEINAESDALDSLAIALTEFDKLRDENNGKIVNAEKPIILQHAYHVALSRTREPGNDDDIEPVKHENPLSGFV